MKKAENEITLFRNYFNPDPVADLTVFDFCNYVQNSQEYVQEIEALRDTKIKKEQRDKIKATLPAVTISGRFSKREAAGLIRHSGFICLDLDAGKNDITDWPAVRDTLMDCENVYFTALSASGKGVFCLIPIAFPYLHKQQAIQLITDFAIATGLHPDQSCKDVCRLRGISYDPEAKFNQDAIKYYGVYREPAQHSRTSITVSTSPIETARRMIKEAGEGERHETILRAARLLGGYVATGKVNESEAAEVLRIEAKNKLPSQRHGEIERVIRDGMENGKLNPIQ